MSARSESDAPRLFKPNKEQSPRIAKLIARIDTECGVFTYSLILGGLVSPKRMRDLAADLSQLADALEKCDAVPLHPAPAVPQ